MGWDGIEIEGPCTKRRVLEIACGADAAARALAIARKGSVIYAAIREATGDAVVGVVVLTERKRGWLYTKVISDSMNPAEDRCPAAVLALLSEPRNDDGREWRQRCREQLVRAAIHAQAVSR